MSPITSLYAALIALLFVVLSVRVIRVRIRLRVTVGDGDHQELRRAMRVQANCAEYAPLGLLLLMLVETQAAPVWLVHGLGSLLLAGRLIHAWGMGQSPEKLKLRQAGMMCTFATLVVQSLYLLSRWL